MTTKGACPLNNFFTHACVDTHTNDYAWYFRIEDQEKVKALTSRLNKLEEQIKTEKEENDAEIARAVEKVGGLFLLPCLKGCSW